MEKKRNFRVKVMHFAHVIYNSCVTTWSDALKKAWELYRLAKGMRRGIVKFVFEKVDGSARIAYGTLKDLPAGVTTGKGKSEPNYTTMRYWDTKKNAFRSFRISNFIAVM